MKNIFHFLKYFSKKSIKNVWKYIKFVFRINFFYKNFPNNFLKKLQNRSFMFNGIPTDLKWMDWPMIHFKIQKPKAQTAHALSQISTSRSLSQSPSIYIFVEREGTLHQFSGTNSTKAQKPLFLSLRALNQKKKEWRWEKKR